jgi:Polyketide cyclase / dehydrase and lipid transport
MRPAIAGPSEPMPHLHVDLVSHWRIAAPVDRVWAELADPRRWPLWWPGISEVRTLRPGSADGTGSVQRVQWATRWRVRIAVEIETREALQSERLRSRSRGVLQGEGIWLLRAKGSSTELTCVWRIERPDAWMRWLALFVTPLLRWSHRRVMRAGEAGLQRHLAADLAGGQAHP